MLSGAAQCIREWPGGEIIEAAEKRRRRSIRPRGGGPEETALRDGPRDGPFRLTRWPQEQTLSRSKGRQHRAALRPDHAPQRPPSPSRRCTGFGDFFPRRCPDHLPRRPERAHLRYGSPKGFVAHFINRSRHDADERIPGENVLSGQVQCFGLEAALSRVARSTSRIEPRPPSTAHKPPSSEHAPGAAKVRRPCAFRGRSKRRCSKKVVFKKAVFKKVVFKKQVSKRPCSRRPFCPLKGRSLGLLTLFERGLC
ncbi:hypothetical protein M885DRAFT_290219 [Pelagophyceae sp. CCMP2097]|nr:hypothetical protein M885DRAFT_290219 [Pelagophyceae sp. CCMP2097]